MSKRIEIDFTASTVELDDAGKRVSQEIERIGDSAETAMQNLSEVADKNVRAYLEHQKELGRTGEDVGRELGKAALEGDRQARQLRNSIEREAREIRKAFDDGGAAAQEMATDVGEAAGGMKMQLTDVTAFVQQMQSSIKAAVEGNIVEAVNGASTAVGALVTTVNPLVGSAIAAVGGLASGLINNFSKDAEEIRGRTEDMFRNMLSTGQQALDEAQIMANVADIVAEKGDRYKAALALDSAGFATASEALRAMAGDTEAVVEISERLASAQGDIAAKAGELQEKREALGPMADATDLQMLQDQTLALSDQQHELEVLGSEVGKVAEAYQNARRDLDLVADAAKHSEDRAKAATEQHAAMYEEIERLPTSKTVEVNADTAKAMTALNAMKRAAESMVLRVTADVVDRYGRPIL